MLSDYISLPTFILSFAIGLFFIYVLGPEKKTIYIYPTPENYTKIQFKDKLDECFQYSAKQIDCPMNPLLINTIPAQTS